MTRFFYKVGFAITMIAVGLATASYGQTGSGPVHIGVQCPDGKVYKPGEAPCQKRPPSPARQNSPTTYSVPDNSAQIEAERRAAAAAESNRRVAAEQAAAERRRKEQEEQERFDRNKKGALGSLKGTGSGGLLLKGAETQDFELKGTGHPSNAGPLSPEKLYIDGILALAGRLKWTQSERERLRKAIDKLAIPDLPDILYKDVQDVWRVIRDRKQPDELIDVAEKTKGWNSPSAGRQTNEECAIFAMANASGLPYDFVRGLAVSLLEQGNWRALPEQISVDKTVKAGLSGGELLMLSEFLGQVEIVSEDAFRSTLNSGVPIMIDVFTTGKSSDGEGIVGQHQVVLSRTFEYGGTTWYEMIDSHLSGAWDRRYLTKDELKAIQIENGVVFRPESKPLVKKTSAKRKTI